jgi:cell division septum initiation protein DivIVA
VPLRNAKGDGVTGFLTTRLAGALSGSPSVSPGTRRGGDLRQRLDGDRAAVYRNPVLPRFPVARHGYDRDAVDEYIARLESDLVDAQAELLELRGRGPSIAEEIERLGEQTSAILITAHDAASETVTVAQTEAGTRIADATSYAAALREEATAERYRVQSEIAALRRERGRLIGETERNATALSSLAADARAVSV